MKTIPWTVAAAATAASLLAPPGVARTRHAAQPAGAAGSFRMQEIASGFGVGYAVAIADMNGDRRPDIVAISGTQAVWFDNPAWRRQLLLDGGTTPDNVCLAVHDLDGDGRLDVALGAAWDPRNTTGGGTLQWLGRTAASEPAREAPGAAVSAQPFGPTQVFPIAEEPTLHRIAWADVDGDGRRELVAAPLHGRGTRPPTWDGPGARVLVFRVPAAPRRDPWPVEIADDTLHVLHNFTVADLDRDGRDELVTASREGLHVLSRLQNGTWTRRLIGEGAPGEVKLGTIGGRRRAATIEPWHGNTLVVYTESWGLWKRTVLDDTLTGGHALRWADFDGDGADELTAGWRDKEPGLAVYSVRDDGSLAAKSMVDAGGMATEDLAVGDLDGDGRPDIVASGRATSNVRIYWNTLGR